MNNELLKRYKQLFGEDAPIPPQHIMKTLIEMKEKGRFDEKMDKYEKVIVMKSESFINLRKHENLKKFLS